MSRCFICCVKLASGERFLELDKAAFGSAAPEAFDRFFNRGKYQR